MRHSFIPRLLFTLALFAVHIAAQDKPVEKYGDWVEPKPGTAATPTPTALKKPTESPVISPPQAKYPFSRWN